MSASLHGLTLHIERVIEARLDQLESQRQTANRLMGGQGIGEERCDIPAQDVASPHRVVDLPIRP